MATLPAISTVTSSATALSNLILVTPQNTIGYQPQNGLGAKAPQAKPILFHYEGEQTAVLESDITDHYAEDNTAIQDQIALRPEVITTHGFIGELNDVAPAALAPLQAIANKLTIINAYTPSLSTTALLAYNEAAFLYATAQAAINAAISTWGSINGSGGEAVIDGNGIVGNPTNQTKQQVVFQQFYGYWRSRTLFTIQTPWAVFQNMAIKSLRAIQDAETNVITDFEVSFKLIRLASTFTAPSRFDNNNFDGRLQQQGADPTNLGNLQLTPGGPSQASALSGVA